MDLKADSDFMIVSLPIGWRDNLQETPPLTKSSQSWYGAGIIWMLYRYMHNKLYIYIYTLCNVYICVYVYMCISILTYSHFMLYIDTIYDTYSEYVNSEWYSPATGSFSEDSPHWNFDFACGCPGHAMPLRWVKRPRPGVHQHRNIGLRTWRIYDLIHVGAVILKHFHESTWI